ncbi:hypothetical protein ABMA58_14260 [Oceanospirillum sp. HFRX-1_2]
MAFVQLNYLNQRPLALLAGAEGNVPALKACLHQARRQGAGIRLFLGNAFGAFGHSDETLYQLETQCTWLVRGQHERLLLQRFSPRHGSLHNNATTTLFDTPDEHAWQWLDNDTRLRRAQSSFSYHNIGHLCQWADLIRLQTPNGAILACHDSPDYLFPSTLNQDSLDKSRILHWLDQYHCQGLIIGSDHQPWIEHLPEGRFIASCGASGFASHPLYSDVHYLLIEPFRDKLIPRVERVTYDVKNWADQLHTEGVSSLLTYPLLKGLPPPDN